MQSGPAPGSRSHAAVPAAVSNTHDTPLARDHTYEYSDPAAGAAERGLPASSPQYAVPWDDGGIYTAPDATQPVIYDRQSDGQYAVSDASQRVAYDAQNNGQSVGQGVISPVYAEPGPAEYAVSAGAGAGAGATPEYDEVSDSVRKAQPTADPTAPATYAVFRDPAAAGTQPPPAAAASYAVFRDAPATQQTVL